LQEKSNNKASPDIDILVERAVDGDVDAFGRLYDLHVERVYRHAFYRVGNVADAEDLTQQVFLKAWQAIHRYRKTAIPFLAWLLKISHNLVVDFYRSNKTNVYIDLDLDIFASKSSPNPENAAVSQFEQQRMRKVILELPGDQQQVVLMRFIEGFSYSEIAATIGKREGAVRVILHRALARLRKDLEKAEQ